MMERGKEKRGGRPGDEAVREREPDETGQRAPGLGRRPAEHSLRIRAAHEQDGHQHDDPGADEQPGRMVAHGVGNEATGNRDREWRARRLQGEQRKLLALEMFGLSRIIEHGLGSSPACFMRQRGLRQGPTPNQVAAAPIAHARGMPRTGSRRHRCRAVLAAAFALPVPAFPLQPAGTMLSRKFGQTLEIAELLRLGHGLQSRRHAKLVENVAEMLFHRPLRNAELPGDDLVRAAVKQPLQDSESASR